MSIYNTPLEERFGEKLEELREGKNMTREQLADQVGLTARHIAALERGERRPTLNTMEKLLRALGAPTEWLVYPEFEEQNARLREISHLAATFSDEQLEFLLGMMRLMRKQKAKIKPDKRITDLICTGQHLLHQLQFHQILQIYTDLGPGKSGMCIHIVQFSMSSVCQRCQNGVINCRLPQFLRQPFYHKLRQKAVPL